MGQSLSRSVEQYNRFVGTLESRVLVTARRMHELHLTSERSPALAPLEGAPRSLSAPELTGGMESMQQTAGGADDALDDGFGRGARDTAYLEGERRAAGSDQHREASGA
jgi:DNA recombination protein RmuC